MYLYTYNCYNNIICWFCIYIPTLVESISPLGPSWPASTLDLAPTRTRSTKTNPKALILVTGNQGFHTLKLDRSVMVSQEIKLTFNPVADLYIT